MPVESRMQVIPAVMSSVAGDAERTRWVVSIEEPSTNVTRCEHGPWVCPNWGSLIPAADRRPSLPQCDDGAYPAVGLYGHRRLPSPC